MIGKCHQNTESEEEKAAEKAAGGAKKDAALEKAKGRRCVESQGGPGRCSCREGKDEIGEDAAKAAKDSKAEEKDEMDIFKRVQTDWNSEKEQMKLDKEMADSRKQTAKLKQMQKK